MTTLVPAPLSVTEIVPAKQPERAGSARAVNAALLVPVTGAFLQLVVTHRVPSLGWALALLVTAFATRVFKGRFEARERPAFLGHDGLELADAFVPPGEMASVIRDREIVTVAMRSGARHELRVDEGAIGVDLLVEALGRGIARASEQHANPAGLLAALGAMTADHDPYRGLGVDVGRCLGLVEDTGASPKVRVAAARLLVDHVDDDVRARIAEVADSTADPTLRDVLAAPASRRPRA